MNKIIIALVVLVLSGFGVYYFFFKPIPINPTDQSKISELSKQELTVVYTNEGYTPKQLTIKKGDTVKFINMSDRRVWTASDEHPAHTIYPEFDQKTAAPKLNEYTFKFEKVGTWGYHNHVFSSHIGTITVTQ
jgi:plastocyanin